MPTDTRRLTGPEECFSPYDFCSPPDSNTEGLLKLKLKDSPRPDGRSCDQLRPIFLRAGVVSQAKGSSYIEMDRTKVICAVYGPREIQRKEDFSLKGQLTCDFKFMTFSCKQRRGHQQDEQERDLSVRILEAMESSVCLHKYPKSQMNIYVMVLQNDGCALAAAILSATVALASAGVEMYDLVLASSVAVNGPLVLDDPTEEEEGEVLNRSTKSEAPSGTTTVAFLPSINQISAVSSDGHLPVDVLKQNLQACVKNCQKIYPVVRLCLISHFVEISKKKG